MSATVGPGICGRMEGCILAPHLDTRPCVFESDLSPAYLRRRPIGVRGSSLRDIVGDEKAAEFAEKQRARKKAAEKRAREYRRGSPCYACQVGYHQNHVREYSALSEYGEVCVCPCADGDAPNE